MPIEIKVPELGESVVEATVGRWLKNEGDQVSVGEVVVELETDKVNLEVGAERAGVLAKIIHQKGDDVKVGEALGIIDETAAAPAPDKQAPAAQPAPNTDSKPAEPAPTATPAAQSAEKVTPVAKRVAEEFSVDVSQVQPSGPGGRVTKGDVERYVADQHSKPQTAPAQAPAATSGPTPVPAPKPPLPTKNGREERVKMSRRRRTIATRLVEAQQTAAMLTTFNEIDLSAVMELRERRKESFKKLHGIGLGISSFFVKAVVAGLRDYPHLNAEIDGDEIIVKHYYDIGVAIGAPEGLVVPVLRNADRLSFAEIETGIKRFAQQAQEGSLSLEDLRGGTFTITNGGVFGSMLSTPILNMPQVGILGLHKIEQRPIVFNGQIVAHPMMYVALSYDHRIVDGETSVKFLVRIKELIEEPELLLIEG